MDDPSEDKASSENVEVDITRTIEALECRTLSQRFIRFNAEFTLFRKGFDLSLELIHFLGDLPPKDSYDKTQRDLACDTLDSLWLAEYSLLRGYESHTLLLLRRAYETTSLMAYFFNFPDKVQVWESGKRIHQTVIRKALGDAPVAESKDALDEMYRVYSLFSHVNRESLYHRLLGEGNRLTLGCQGNVDEKSFSRVVRELLAQMMWFVDVANFIFLKIGLRPSEDYGKRMLAYRGQVQNLAKGLPALFSQKPSSKKP